MKLNQLVFARHAFTLRDAPYVEEILESLLDSHLNEPPYSLQPLLRSLIQALVRNHLLDRHVTVINDTSLDPLSKIVKVITSDPEASKAFADNVAASEDLAKLIASCQCWQLAERLPSVSLVYAHCLPLKDCLSSFLEIAAQLHKKYPSMKVVLRIDTFLSRSDGFWSLPMVTWLRDALPSFVTLDELWKNVKSFTEISDFYEAEKDIPNCMGLLLVDTLVFRGFLDVYFPEKAPTRSLAIPTHILVKPMLFVYLENEKPDTWRLRWSDLDFACLKKSELPGKVYKYDEEIILGRIMEGEREEFVVVRKNPSLYTLIEEETLPKRARKNTILTTKDEPEVVVRTPERSEAKEVAKRKVLEDIDGYNFLASTFTNTPSGSDKSPRMLQGGVVFEKLVSKSSLDQEDLGEFYPVHVTLDNFVSSAKDKMGSLQRRLSEFTFKYPEEGRQKELVSGRKRAQSAAFYLGSESDSDSASDAESDSEDDSPLAVNGDSKTLDTEEEKSVEELEKSEEWVTIPSIIEPEEVPEEVPEEASERVELGAPSQSDTRFRAISLVDEKVAESFRELRKNDHKKLVFEDPLPDDLVTEDYLGLGDEEDDIWDKEPFSLAHTSSKSMSNILDKHWDNEAVSGRSRLFTVLLPLRDEDDYNVVSEETEEEKENQKKEKNTKKHKIILIRNTNSFSSLDIAKDEDEKVESLEEKPEKEANPGKPLKMETNGVPFSSPVYDSFFESLNSISEAFSNGMKVEKTPKNVANSFPLSSLAEVKTRSGARPISGARYKDAVYNNKENKIILVTSENKTSRLDIF